MIRSDEKVCCMPSRIPLPAERDSITRKLQIGAAQGYVTVGLYPDGTPGELLLTVEKPGSLERGLSHALALMISTLLQRGVSIEEVAEKLRGLKFEPSGVTGDPQFPMADSFCDLLGKWLLAKFVPEAK